MTPFQEGLAAVFLLDQHSAALPRLGLFYPKIDKNPKLYITLLLHTTFILNGKKRGIPIGLCIDSKRPQI